MYNKSGVASLVGDVEYPEGKGCTSFSYSWRTRGQLDLEEGKISAMANIHNFSG